MADERKPKPKTFQMRYSQEWMDRVELAAARLDISVASYIRQAVARQMDLEQIPKKTPRR